MTGQDPITTFENYPTAPQDPPSDATSAQPQARSATPARRPLRTTTASGVDTDRLGWNLSAGSLSRRSALGWLVGVPIVGIIGIGLFSQQTVPVGTAQGRFDAVVTFATPSGWERTEDSSGINTINHGSNQVMAVVLENQVGTDSTVMAAALDALMPVLQADPSTATRTTVDGTEVIEVRSTGKVGKKKARQTVDVVIDRSGKRALAIVQLLTAAPGSMITEEAQGFVSALLQEWPW